MEKSWVRYIFLPLLMSVIIIILFVPGYLSRSAEKIEMDEKIHTPVFDRYGSGTLLVFFGYAGCADICMPRLQDIASFYRRLERPEDVQVIFINLLPVEDQNVPDAFAKAFHEDFTGFYPGEEALRRLRDEFNVVFERSLVDEGEYDHTAFLFRLVRERDGYRLRAIYTSAPFNGELILQDIENRKQGQ